MSFETKQKILRSVVEQVEFVGDQITIEHLIPVSDGKSSVNRFDALQNVKPVHRKLTMIALGYE
jgi:hypothetical protein